MTGKAVVRARIMPKKGMTNIISYIVTFKSAWR